MNYRYRDKSELKQVESDWFALVPDNWNVLMFKRIVESVKNGIWGDEPKQNEDDIPCIRILNFNRNEMEVNIDDLTTRNIPILKQRDYLLKKGDLLIEKSGGGEKNPVGFVARYNHDLPAVYANFMAKISLKENEAKSEYIKYLCSNIYNKRIHLDSVNQTTGIQNLDTETYFKRFIPLPNINEQEKIAKFLDEKTAQFDSIISKKEALIEKLEEAKKSLISEVVTGKVKVVKSSDDGYELVERKKEEMKDCGVEWLGEIPNGWEFKSIKYSMDVLNGKEIEDEHLNIDKLIAVFGSGGIFKYTSEVLYNEPSVLFGRKGTIGKPIYVEEPFWTVDTMYYTKIKKNTIPKYMYYMLIIYPWDRITTKTALPSIVASDVLKTKWCLPSLNEQNCIVEYLDIQFLLINKLINKIKKQIEKLKEAKQSLISEAVTGKIEILD